MKPEEIAKWKSEAKYAVDVYESADVKLQSHLYEVTNQRRILELCDEVTRLTNMYVEANDLKKHYCKERGQYLTMCKKLRGEVLNEFDQLVLAELNQPHQSEGQESGE